MLPCNQKVVQHFHVAGLTVPEEKDSLEEARQEKSNKPSKFLSLLQEDSVICKGFS